MSVFALVPAPKHQPPHPYKLSAASRSPSEPIP